MMSAARHLTVYDGTKWLGEIVVTGAGRASRYIARDVHRRKVGTHSNIKAAVAAIPSLRSSSGVPRKRRQRGGDG